MRVKEYWKLKKLRDLAEDLDYDYVIKIIDADAEIPESYNEFKESGLTDEELQYRQRVFEFEEKNSVRIYEKIWDAIRLYTDWEIEEVLEVYEANATQALFVAVEEGGFSYLIGELNNYHTIAPTWNEVMRTDDEQEAHEIFVKQLNLISGY